jgi:hypothetical protein
VAESEVERGEFEGYIRRHESDIYAHAAMRHELRNDIVGAVISNEKRLTNLELWRAWITGAVAMLGFLVAAGIAAGVVELLRR